MEQMMNSLPCPTTNRAQRFKTHLAVATSSKPQLRIHLECRFNLTTTKLLMLSCNENHKFAGRKRVNSEYKCSPNTGTKFLTTRGKFCHGVMRRHRYSLCFTVCSKDTQLEAPVSHTRHWLDSQGAVGPVVQHSDCRVVQQAATS